MMEEECVKTRYTIKEWLDIWLDVYAASKCRESTLISYRDCRRRLLSVFPDFENSPLESLRPFEFQRCINALAEIYAKSTVSHIRVVYNQAYEEAVRNHFCQWNPISSTLVPKKAKERQVRGLSQEEQKAFEEALKQMPVLDQFVLLTFLYTGLRRGELESLTWDDWDRKNCILRIRQSKTERGVRDVPVIPEIALILTHLWATHDKECPYIFAYHGEKMTNYHLRWVCKKAAQIAGITHVHPHMLRHTFASRMVEKKVDPKSLATIIGHTDVAFTMRTYVNVDETHHLRGEMMKLSQIAEKKAPHTVETEQEESSMAQFGN